MSHKHDHAAPQASDTKELSSLIVDQARLLNEEKRVDRKMFWIAVCSSIVAVLATGAAIWSAYEAHMTRKEGKNIGLQALQLQDHALRLDERPYLRSTFEGISGEPITAGPPDTPIKGTAPFPHLKLSALGRTPALNVEYFYGCFLYADYGNFMHPLHDPMLGWSGSRKYSTFVGNLFPNESRTITLPCEPDKTRSYLSSLAAFYILQGGLTYTDEFDAKHETPFCFAARRDVNKWLPCEQGSETGGKNPN